MYKYFPNQNVQKTFIQNNFNKDNIFHILLYTDYFYVSQNAPNQIHANFLYIIYP